MKSQAQIQKVYKPSTPRCSMVKRLYKRDNENFVALAAGYLPSFEQIKSLEPKSPREFGGMPDFKSRDEAAAWVLSAAYRRASWWMFARATCRTIPIKTWLIGSPQSNKARFAKWFEDEPDNTDYRIFIHRSPLEFVGYQVEPIWPVVYGSNGTTFSRVVQGQRHLSPDERRLGRSFLQELLDSYQARVENMEMLFKNSGHPYEGSEGHPRRA